jgi:hypothetical protein
MANEQNLLRETSEVVFRRPDGRLESTRTARGKAFAERLFFGTLGENASVYEKNLLGRILAGEAKHQETYLLRLLFGDPPKAKEDDGAELNEHFERLRDELNYMLRQHPELARQMAAAVSQRSARLALPMPESPREPETQDVDDALL